MKRFKKILVATDSRYESHPVVNNAADIAKRNDAQLTIVDVVPDFSWLVRMTMKDHAHFRELITAEKHQKLDELAAPLRASGVDVAVKVLGGATSVEIIREVLREGHDLVMRVAKAKSSKHKGIWGSTGIRLLRQCPCAVWLATTPFEQGLHHVLGCLDTSAGDDADVDDELNTVVYELADSIHQYHGARLSLVHAWSIFNEPMIHSRMDDAEFEEFVEKNRERAGSQLNAFLAQHDASTETEGVRLLKGDAWDVIPGFVRVHGVDLVVMGTVARSGVSGIIMGNTAEQILNQLECSVLALKPKDFVCPIKLH